MWIAVKTLFQIQQCLENDQGATFRQWEQKVLPHIGDAYRGYDEPFRNHLGASVMGQDCARAIWYGYRWSKKPHFDGRMLRLFNRGHLEEGRFIALLLMIGVQVYQQDENGKQFRISHRNGLIGGSGDGKAFGVPDYPGHMIGLEFKTHSEKSFMSLAKGVKEAKYEHFVQMQMYMQKMELPAFLYMAVNKNTDAIHAEIVVYDPMVADEFFARAERILDATTPPRKINKSASYWKCKFCDSKMVCHYDAPPEINCRTCEYGAIVNDKWTCNKLNLPLDECKVNPMEGCFRYKRSESFKK